MKAALLLLVMLTLGCVNNMQVVEKGNIVAVDYTGTLENGTVFDSSLGKSPLEFEAGAGQMIKGFDAAVLGMSLNEEKRVTIPPEESYGMPDSQRIIEVPLTSIPDGTKEGNTLYAAGQPVKVIEIRNETAIIDANHPLAGKTLIFSIKIVKIERR